MSKFTYQKKIVIANDDKNGNDQLILPCILMTKTCKKYTGKESIFPLFFSKLIARVKCQVFNNCLYAIETEINVNLIFFTIYKNGKLSV